MSRLASLLPGVTCGRYRQIRTSSRVRFLQLFSYNGSTIRLLNPIGYDSYHTEATAVRPSVAHRWIAQTGIVLLQQAGRQAISSEAKGIGKGKGWIELPGQSVCLGLAWSGCVGCAGRAGSITDEQQHRSGLARFKIKEMVYLLQTRLRSCCRF
jgi:hypothetical protein